VLRERADGHRIFYGDVRRPAILRAVGVAEASLVIVTLDDFTATENIVAAVHEAQPDLTILARGHNAKQCRTLRKLGASLACHTTGQFLVPLGRMTHP
jgi:voltage-gated potassium channel Kch